MKAANLETIFVLFYTKNILMEKVKMSVRPDHRWFPRDLTPFTNRDS